MLPHLRACDDQAGENKENNHCRVAPLEKIDADFVALDGRIGPEQVHSDDLQTRQATDKFQSDNDMIFIGRKARRRRTRRVRNGRPATMGGGCDSPGSLHRELG